MNQGVWGFVSKIKIMAIAPYEGLKELLVKIGARYSEQAEVDVVVGDLREGVEQARAAEAAGYDIIISRGGTAEMMAQYVSIPVVNVEVSGYDFLRAITTAKNFPGNKAMVGFSYITENARSVNDLMQTDIRIFTIQSQDEVAPLLRRLTSEDEYSLIIGDVVTERVASEMGLNGMLLTSGEESVNSAFQTALKICGDIEAYRRNSNLYLRVLEQGVFRVVVFSIEKNLLYSNFDLDTAEISAYELVKYIDNIAFSGSQDMVLKSDAGYVHVRGRLLEIDSDQRAVAFYLSGADAPEKKELKGVHFRNIQFQVGNGNVVQQVAAYDKNTSETIAAFSKSDLPVLLSGDYGVGKSRMAYAIHRYSSNSHMPFITIDCAAALPETWETLMLSEEERYASLAGATLCFEDLDSLPQKYQSSLRTTLNAAADKPRYRYIATASSDTDRLIAQGKLDPKIVSFFSDLTLTLPGLQSSGADLKSMVGMFIIESNARIGKQVVGISDEALDLLARCRFRNHYEELRQVIDQAVVTCQRPHIGKEDIQAVLAAREGNFDYGDNVSLEGTLEEIELRIIEQVLREENGNLSKTAKRLGIGRSTLWRKLGNNEK